MNSVSSPTVPMSPRSNSVDHEENDRFAFERAQFSRTDFTVQRFIYLAGKRTNLEQIHAGLRGYLRELQNAMVGLINDDYADFVNLSSNLAGLKESTDKVSSDINGAWDAFHSSTASIRKTSELLHQKSSELSSSRSRQIFIRNKIAFFTSLNRLAECLSNRPSDVSSKWYAKFVYALTAVEFWHARIPEIEIAPKAVIAKEACFSKARQLIIEDLIADLHGECRLIGLIFASLNMIGQVKFGMLKISDALVKNSLQSEETSDVLRLKAYYEQIFKLREHWAKNCRLHNQFTKEVEKFLDDALLQFVLNHLDEHLGELCIPSEPEVFFEAFNSTYDFARRFPHINQHLTFLKGLADRFNVHLYVKRVSAALNEEVLARTANTRVAWRENATDNEHPLKVSNTILNSIAQMFSPAVFLPIVADRIWEFALHLINKHTEWLDYCLSAEPTRVVDELSGTVTVLDRWPDLVILFAGSKKFDALLFELCLKTIFKKLEEMGADATPFRQFLSEYNGKLELKQMEIRRKIVEQLLELAVKRLQAGVGEIPKRYRWTKKPSPTEHSSYVDESMEVQSKFGEIATKHCWGPDMIMGLSEELLNGMVDCFLTNAQQVLNSVQMTGSSLQRFKRKGLSAGENNAVNGTAGETDESKIRRQLQLDTQRMRTHAESANANVQKLDDFLKLLEQESA